MSVDTMQTRVADKNNDTVDPMTSCSVSNSTSGSTATTESAEHDVTTLLWAIGGPIVLAVGVVGNVLILVTMTRRHMKNTSTCIYLCAMAALDLTVLAAGLTPNWLEGAEYIVIKELNPPSCKMQKFFDYTTGDSAVWCRVLFTIDRLIAVLMPLYSGSACGRPTSARIYVVIACVVAVAKNANVLVTRGAEFSTLPVCSNSTLKYQTVLVDVCGYPNEHYEHFEKFIRPWLAIIFVSVGPFIVIAVCNSLIIAALVLRRRKTIQTSSSHADKHFFQLAFMCVAASGLFLVCSFPTIVLLIGKPYWNVPPGKNPAYQVSKAVSNLLFYVTFSANFFLYCISGDRFRSTLRSVICCDVADNRPSMLAARRSEIQRITPQQSTINSSMACTTVTAVPSAVTDSQLTPVGSASSLQNEGLTIEQSHQF